MRSYSDEHFELKGNIIKIFEKNGNNEYFLTCNILFFLLIIWGSNQDHPFEDVNWIVLENGKLFWFKVNWIVLENGKLFWFKAFIDSSILQCLIEKPKFLFSVRSLLTVTTTFFGKIILKPYDAFDKNVLVVWCEIRFVTYEKKTKKKLDSVTEIFGKNERYRRKWHYIEKEGAYGSGISLLNTTDLFGI